MAARIRPPLENAARALCQLRGLPQDTRFNDAPMWHSVAFEALTVLAAALPEEELRRGSCQTTLSHSFMTQSDADLAPLSYAPSAYLSLQPLARYFRRFGPVFLSRYTTVATSSKLNQVHAKLPFVRTASKSCVLFVRHDHRASVPGPQDLHRHVPTFGDALA